MVHFLGYAMLQPGQARAGLTVKSFDELQHVQLLTRTSRNQKKKIKSARKVAETRRPRKGFFFAIPLRLRVLA
jgi:hypothetical protein